MYFKVNYITYFYFVYKQIFQKIYFLNKTFHWIGSSAFSNSMRTEISENLSDKENILLYFDQNFRWKVKYVFKVKFFFRFSDIKKETCSILLTFLFSVTTTNSIRKLNFNYDEANIFLADTTIHLSLLNNFKLFLIVEL